MIIIITLVLIVNSFDYMYMFIHSFIFLFHSSKGGTSEYNRLCGCVSNNIQAINKNGKVLSVVVQHFSWFKIFQASSFLTFLFLFFIIII